jgi:hypothetical protein
MNNDTDLSTSALFRALRAEEPGNGAALHQATLRAEERWPLLKSSKLAPWTVVNSLSLADKELRRHRDHEQPFAANDALSLTSKASAGRADPTGHLTLDARLAQGLLKMVDSKAMPIEPPRSVARALTPVAKVPSPTAPGRIAPPSTPASRVSIAAPSGPATRPARSAPSSLRSLLSKIEGQRTSSSLSTSAAPLRKVPSFLARLGPR